MGKTVAEKQYFTFVKGLNTEAGPLTYPNDTWQDGDNVVPALDGSLNKRTAVNYESGFVLSGGQLAPNDLPPTQAVVVGEWNSVGGNGALNFLVVQQGRILRFYLNTGNTVSSTEQPFTIDLHDYPAGDPTFVGLYPISCASAVGTLIIASANVELLRVTYNTTGPTITVTPFTLKIRDLIGLNDGLAVDNRTGTLSSEHRYNLFNQGWLDAQINAYFAAVAVYPSNAQSWTAGKDAAGVFTPAVLDKVDFGTSHAPRGRFVLDTATFNRAAACGFSIGPGGALGTNVQPWRPTTCAFYAGRAWYAGVNSVDIGSWVFFSQVADEPGKYEKCYQEADPTSESISDLVDSDGGVIPIQDAGNVVRIMAVFDSLLVFADNGVWQISGTLTTGFSASSFQVKRISTVGCVSPTSVVATETAVFYWAVDGIWAIAPNPGGVFAAQSLTQTTIQSLYGAIPMTGRTLAAGVYHQEAKTVYWAFNDDPAQDGASFRFIKNRLLCLDMRLASFFTMRVSPLQSLAPYVAALAVTKNKTTLVRQDQVVDVANNPVVDGSGNLVVINAAPLRNNTELRFLTQVPVGALYKTTFSKFEDGTNASAKFSDWWSANSVGASYPAYILTGYDLGTQQGGDKFVQGLYVTVFLKRTESGVDGAGAPIGASSCTLQTRWDWSNNVNTGKWSPGEEVYRHKRLFEPNVPSVTFDDGYPVVVTKSKVRGRGRAVQFKFTADPTKDMKIAGWAVPFVGNTNV